MKTKKATYGKPQRLLLDVLQEIDWAHLAARIEL